MRPVAHLANLDLNLLVALRELTRKRSVTRAAQRLGVTQPPRPPRWRGCAVILATSCWSVSTASTR
jgi:hypothetical protein